MQHVSFVTVSLKLHLTMWHMCNMIYLLIIFFSLSKATSEKCETEGVFFSDTLYMLKLRS